MAVSPDIEAGYELAGSETPEELLRLERRAELEARTYTFADLLYQVPEKRDPLLGPLVRRGWRTMIAGYTGEGKTTLTNRFVRAIMLGDEFLGWEGAGNGARVLFLDLEQDLVIAQRRMVETYFPRAWDETLTVPEMIDGRSIPPEFSDSVYCRWSEGLSLNTGEVDGEVVERKIEQVQPDLVVVAPLYKAFEGNPNETELAVQVMRILDKWRERYGFGLVVEAHMRKPNRQGASFTKHDVSSSGAWIFGAEVVLGIRRLQGNGAALHFFKDRAGDLTINEHWTLEYNVDKGYRRMAGDAGEDGGKLPAREQIWRLIQQNSPNALTLNDIGDMLHMPLKTVRAATNQLRERKEAGGGYAGLMVDFGQRGALCFAFTPDPVEHQLSQIFGDEEGE